MLSPQELMDRAIEAAELCPRAVRPNPRVGAALLSRDGQVVVGYHPYCGGPHAERVVLDLCAKKSISTKGAMMAVSLEPCSHHGKTSPCCEALVAAGISNVYFALNDPNPRVSGKGEAYLESHGVSVQKNMSFEKAFALNREWLWAQKMKRPFVTLKMATSLNHVWVSSDRRWITGADARFDAMTLRARVDCILTSGATLRNDQPQMTLRNKQGELYGTQPEVLVLSRKMKNEDLSSFALSKISLEEKSPLLRRVSIESWDNYEEELRKLFERGIFDVMIEAGPELSQEFLKQKLVDEIWYYQNQSPGSEKLAGEERDLSSYFKEFRLIDSKKIADDERTRWLSYEKEIAHF